jgi:hypothetical protein
MNESTRRVTSRAIAVLLIAALAAAAAKPVGATPHEDKSKSKNTFTLKASLIHFPWTALWTGDFTATGAIKDRGDAFYTYDGPLHLEGEKGSIGISISGNTFSVASGTGAYEGLAATGSAQVSETHGGNYRKMKISLDGTVLSEGR